MYCTSVLEEATTPWSPHLWPLMLIFVTGEPFQTCDMEPSGMRIKKKVTRHVIIVLEIDMSCENFRDEMGHGNLAFLFNINIVSSSVWVRENVNAPCQPYFNVNL